MTASSRFVPVFFFFIVFVFALICRVDEVSADDLQLYTIHVNDDMVGGAGVTRVNCSYLPSFTNKMWPGQEFHYSDLRKYRVLCNGMWSDKDAVWQAFDPVRDAGQKHMYTSIREDGFYFSHDQSSWSKISKWYP